MSRGIVVPEDTLFLGALHDTTTDAVIIYDAEPATGAHAENLNHACVYLEKAGSLARAERALAGCKAFVATPRARAAGKCLEGRAFLHDYDWRQDEGFGVLELIMTAPVVVASWISLRYYGSTVAPQTFSGGNKLLHNVVGGMGVPEGNGGMLGSGLPWQSVHNGEEFVHEPLRLSVCIEAPKEAIADILKKHEGLRTLFDNRWLHLFALDENRHITWRYVGHLQWETVGTEKTGAEENVGSAQ